MPRRREPIPTPAEVLQKLQVAGVSERQVRAAFRTIRFDGGVVGARARQMKVPKGRASALLAIQDVLKRHHATFCCGDTHPMEREVASAYETIETAVQVLVRRLDEASIGEQAVALSSLPVGAIDLEDLYLRLKRLQLPKAQRIRDLDLAVLTIHLIPALVKPDKSYEQTVATQHDYIRQRLSRYRSKVLRLVRGSDVFAAELVVAKKSTKVLRHGRRRTKRVTR